VRLLQSRPDPVHHRPENKLLTRSADAVQTVSDDEINSFLLGNLCRCTGYVGQLRAIRRYLAGRDAQPADTVAINPAPHKSLAHAADLHGKLRGTSVGKAVEKLDSRSILHGKAVYTDDLAAPDALVIKILRSPHAHARIRSIDTSKAHKVPGVELILTWEDVPQTRFTLAGQSYPEPSPYDRLILDREVRYAGDEVAIIAADSERTALKAMRLIKVDYEILPAVLTIEDALKGETLVHEPDHMVFHLPDTVGKPDISHNIMGAHDYTFGARDASVFDDCDVVLERTYQTQAQAQSMMETFRSYSYLDQWNRLVVISSTQVPFHIKRQLSLALGLPSGRIRVIKPRVGGGFGAKQTSVTEIFPAIVTLKTGKPAKIVYTRQETYTASNSRHAMKATVKIGANRDGTIRALTVDALSDQGAYSLHGWTTLGLVGEKSLPLYNKLEHARFSAKVIYTHKMPAGAFRGYGATQGAFFVESIVNELADTLDIDPAELRLMNIVREGEKTVAYNKHILSSALDRCIEKGKELIGWEREPRREVLSDGKIRATGMAITMQGSGIAHVDVSTVKIQLNESGDFSLLMSPTDVGTGADTILTQMAAEVLNTSLGTIIPIVADTDITPYDPGSYASSGTYVTGRAVVAACEDLKKQILAAAASHYQLDEKNSILVMERSWSLMASRSTYATWRRIFPPDRKARRSPARAALAARQVPHLTWPDLRGSSLTRRLARSGCSIMRASSTVARSSIPTWPASRQKAASSRASASLSMRKSATVKMARSQQTHFYSIKSRLEPISGASRSLLKNRASQPDLSEPNRSVRS